MMDGEKLSHVMAKTLAENQEVKYAQFVIKTMSLPDGRLAQFKYVLEPITDVKSNTPTPQTTKVNSPPAKAWGLVWKHTEVI